MRADENLYSTENIYSCRSLNWILVLFIFQFKISLCFRAHYLVLSSTYSQYAESTQLDYTPILICAHAHIRYFDKRGKIHYEGRSTQGFEIILFSFCTLPWPLTAFSDDKNQWYCNVLGFFYSRWKFIPLQNSIHNSWLQFTAFLEF
jgi:hypothetical protein